MAVLAAKAGKHMQIEKPLAMSIGELVALKKVLAGKELVFQFGTEARSSASNHKLVDLAVNGFLGEIRKVYVWGPGGREPRNMAWFKGDEEPVPEGLDWDMWLGPAPKVPHNTWRWIGGRFSIHDYTLGPMSNWGIHPLNIMQWWADAAGLGVPVEYDGEVKIDPHPVIDNVYHWDVECVIPAA